MTAYWPYRRNSFSRGGRVSSYGHRPDRHDARGSSTGVGRGFLRDVNPEEHRVGLSRAITLHRNNSYARTVPIWLLFNTTIPICEVSNIHLTLPGPEASDDDVKLLRLIRLRPEPFATASDLEPDTEVGRRQTRNRLDDLVEDGYLNVKTVGRTNVYWLSENGLRRLAQTQE